MGDAAEKLYDDVMKLPPGERRDFARRVLAGGDELHGSQHAPSFEPEPLPEPERRAAPKEILALAAAVYEGLSEEEIREVEAIAMDRRDFFRRTG